MFCKHSPNGPYKKDFRFNPHKWESGGESAFGATKKPKEEINRNWNKKDAAWV
jgi:hypothetical protein